MTSAETVREVYKGFLSGDLQAVLAMMDPEIEWREAEGNPYQPSGEAWIGPDAVEENLYKKMPTDWKRFIVDAKEFHEAGDTIVVEGRYIAICRPTGKSLDCQFCHVWKVRDGKLVSFQQYIDTARFQEAMKD